MVALLTGHLDARALAAALEALVDRHEALTTCFAEVGGRAVARRGQLPSGLPVVDLSALEKSDADRERQGRVATEAARPFDLERGPLVRWTLLRTGSARHRLLLTVHHIAADGWSLERILEELTELYGQAAGGPPVSLPAMPVEYVDWAAWQRAWLASEEATRQLDWWRTALEGRETLELPFDRPPTGEVSNRGDRVRCPFPPQLGAALHGTARSRGATPFMVLLTALAATLVRLSGARPTGRSKCVMGTPVAGRTRPEAEPVVGLFVNTLALPVELNGSASFADALAATRAMTLGAFSRQDLPFDRVVESLEADRSRRNPLFDVMFTVARAGGVEREAADIKLRAEEVPTRTAKFDLGLSVSGGEDDLAAIWAYRSDLFDRVSVARIARSLSVLMAAALERPEVPLARLPHLAEAERHQALHEWSRDAWSPRAESGVAELFRERAAAHPDRSAVVFEGQVLSYGELALRGGVLAGLLAARGVGPERRVGLYLERSPEMVVALLAVLWSGAAYVPLEPEHPDERLRFQIEDAELALIVCQAAGADRMGSLAPEVPLQRVGGPQTSGEPGAEPPAPTPPGAMAYVIYTSGSTGRPKGVAVSHGAMANRLRFAAATDPAAHGCGISKASISFDLSILEMWTPLVGGGRLVVVRPGGHRDLPYLVRRLAEERVTQISLLPSQLAALLDLGGLEEASALEAVMTGGEAVPPDLPERFYRRHPHLRLSNRYGPTETTISTLSWPCESVRSPRTLPIGRSLAGSEAVLLDAGGEAVAIGQPGELTVAGPGVARGYLARPTHTAERFLPAPWKTAQGARAYRTGDLGRYRNDGAVEFLGRADQQVKVRGHRIELGEIEAALAQAELARELAVVDLLEPVSSTRRLVAYAVPRASGPTGPELVDALLAAARSGLPSYMVPSAVVELPELPLASSGKIDRRRLPAPEWHSAAGELRAPSGAVEERIASVFAELLDVDTVSADASFFDLGGHSLLATRLVARLEEELGVTLPLRELFEHPTVVELAEVVAATGPRRPASSAAGGPRVVPLAAGRAKAPPLVLVHGILGEVFSLHHLAEHLAFARAVHGIESPMLSGGAAPRSCSELAEVYARALRRAVGGRFHLGGLSMGGVVAAEMAHRLGEWGEAPLSLTLLDCPEPSAFPHFGEETGHVRALAAVAAALGVALPAAEGGRPVPPDRAVELLRSAASGEGALGSTSLEGLIEVAVAHGRSLAGHRPSPLTCSTVLFRARATVEVLGPPERSAWGGLAGAGYSAEVVPGDHSTFIAPPRADRLALRMASWLESLDRAVATGDPGGLGEGEVAS